MRTLVLLMLILPIFALAQSTRDEVISEGKQLKAAGNFAKAKELYEGWLASHPSDTELEFSLAQVLYWQGQLKASLRQFDKVIAGEPDNSEAREEREKVLLAMNENYLREVRIGTDLGSYDFFDHNSVGLFASLSWMHKKDWALRAGAHAMEKFDLNGVQTSLGGSYWLTHDWSVDLDLDIGSRADIMPRFCGTLGANWAITRDVTPSFSFRYAHYDGANIFIFMPEINWAAFSFLSLDAKFYAALTGFTSMATLATYSGMLRIDFSPYDYFSLFGGASAGQEAFDPGNPVLGASSYINEHAFGGFKFTVDGHIGAQLSVDQEWRNNNQHITSGEFSVFYTW